jgi:hypothetical protein
MTEYKCKECGFYVSVVDGQIVRQCDCDAPVIANISAIARGDGGVK